MLEPRFLYDRRHFLKIGAAGVMGAALPGTAYCAVDPTVGTGKAKSVLLVLLSGGPSQLDTLDPKPDGPAEIRGEFSTISTTVPSVSICEHLPKLAQQLSRWSVVRSLAHIEHNHLLATHVA